MRFSRKNWLGESAAKNFHRRINALEIHIQDLEARLGELRQILNTIKPDPPHPPETDYPHNPRNLSCPGPGFKCLCWDLDGMPQ